MKKVDPNTIKQIRKIGEGSFADVYLIESPDYGLIAGKYMKSTIKKEDKVMIENEVGVMCKLRHPNIYNSVLRNM